MLLIRVLAMSVPPAGIWVPWFGDTSVAPSTSDRNPPVPLLTVPFWVRAEPTSCPETHRRPPAATNDRRLACVFGSASVPGPARTSPVNGEIQTMHRVATGIEPAAAVTVVVPLASLTAGCDCSVGS